METLDKSVRCEVSIRDCGLADYRQILDLQHELRDQRQAGTIGDTVLIVEHLPVITLGARQTANRMHLSREVLADKKIDVVDIRRGGGATAHNPGQLVFYPIMNLREMNLGINEYISTLQEVGIELLEGLGVSSEKRKGFIGLWVGQKKIASIGVRVSRSVAYHGMAINIQNDLSIFDYIVPCGLDGVTMTSVLRETGQEHSMDEVKKMLSSILTRRFSGGRQN